jgi:hypothetical protein
VYLTLSLTLSISQASAHALATFIESTAVVEAEKTATNASQASAARAAVLNDDFPVQGKHLCIGDTA